MSKATVNGVELYYETAGEGERLVLTHGSWTDGSGWAPGVAALAGLGALGGRYEVVTWDRRGHSRSGAGDHPGSRDEDAADLAGLIEALGGGPVHLVGNSYGSIVVLTVMATRPELVASAVVHEPPVLALLDDTADPPLHDEMARIERDLRVVLERIGSGDHRAAAEYFVDHVALGPGTWTTLPEPFRAVLVANAPTYLDEARDATSSVVDVDRLAAASAPLLLTHGTASPSWFRGIVAVLAGHLPGARVSVIDGAGHIPHATHAHAWAATVLAFHESLLPGRREAAG